MSTTTANMVLIKPDPDGSVGTWDTELNSTIDLVDSHDHSSGKGVRVPVAGLNINADLALSSFALTQAKALAMAAVASGTVTALSRCLFVNSADNELYWKTSGGVLVQLTSGTSLNAALLGGFTGDYGTGGSTASFTSGTSIFNFLRAANHRAFIDSSDIRLFEGTAGVTNAVKLRSPNTLAASYDFVFPTALPGSQQLLQLSSAGQVVASSSGLNSISLTSGQHVTVAGTGLYKRGARWFQSSVTAGFFSTANTMDDSLGGTATVTLNQEFLMPLTLMEGERLLQCVARVQPAGSGDIMRMRVFRGDATGGTTTRTQLGSTATLPGGSASLQTLSVTGLTETANGTDQSYWVEFGTTTVVTSGVAVITFRYQTDVP